MSFHLTCPLPPPGRAMALAMLTHWVCNVAIGQTFVGATATYGVGPVYAVFGAFALGGALFVSKLVRG